MAIITFWNNGKVETGQSMTIAAVATSLAINYNYRILIINSKFNDQSLENAFEPKNNINSLFSRGKMDLASGLSGVAQAIMSNKTSPEIITNFTKIILKDLELLTEKNVSQEEFNKYITLLREIIKLANKYYDIILVDLEGNVQSQQVKQILEISNVKVITLTQNINVLDNFIQEKANNLVLQEGNKIISLGKYDEKSKYTEKNVSKYIKEKKVKGIPYNTIFSMDAPEGRVADYMIRFKRVSPTNINIGFINAVDKETEEIITMIQEDRRKIY